MIYATGVMLTQTCLVHEFFFLAHPHSIDVFVNQAGLASFHWKFRPAGGRALPSSDCPPWSLLGRASASWRENRSKKTPFRLRSAGRRPFQDFEISSLRPLDFNPSTSSRALKPRTCTSDSMAVTQQLGPSTQCVRHAGQPVCATEL
jgi:hypothetical protein